MKRLLVLVVLTAGALLGPAIAAAHPLGNFTVNHYARAELSGGNLYLRYVLDMAEIPTLRERERIDAAGGLEGYAARRAPELARGLEIAVDGRRLPLVPVSQTASLHPGAGGLNILRFAAWYRAPDATQITRTAHRVTLRDATYPGRLGWKEVAVRATSGAKLTDSTAPAADASDELRSYPEDLLSRPLDVERASFVWTPGAGAGLVGPRTRDPESRVWERDSGGLTGLVEGRLSAGVVILALLLAMGWGALHALSPGHGKSMVAAYLVGTRGTARHAFTLGLFVTITHTISVVLFGLATLWLSEYILPDVLFRWLSLIAGAMVVAIGGWVLWRRTRHLRHKRTRGHAFAALPGVRPPELSAAGSSGVRVQVVADDFHDGHERPVHRHGTHELHGHHGSRHHTHDAANVHSHAPPDELSLRNLAVAGFSAGLLPCPSAMVLLLGAIALERVGYGLVLVAAFSVGLAGLLSLIGLLVLYARRFVERLPLDGRFAAAVPVVSALVILVLGIVLTVRALPGVV